LTGEERIASQMAVLAIENTAPEMNTGDVPSIMLKDTAMEILKIFLSEPYFQTFYFNKTAGDTACSEHILLQKAVLSLEPISRAVVVWRDMLGFKIDDLTLAAKCPKKTLYIELNNARKILKNHLAECSVMEIL
jgi:DNA-directed RNA polymerase specialized sigma24 family protein